MSAVGSVAGHLDFATRMLGLLDPRDPRRPAWEQDIARAWGRLADGSYHVAVIGEFSSGKSTFINALLEADLFATGVLRTTGVGVRVRYAREFRVRVLFRDGQLWEAVDPAVGPPAAGQWPRAVRPSGRTVASSRTSVAEVRARLDRLDLRDALAVVTTDPAVAPLVQEVDVGYASALLASGLVLIDTPGANSVDEGPGAAHADIAKEAVAAADAAVVVMPYDQVQSLSLRSFLGDVLDEGMLARCVFVVTRADHLDTTEWDDLREARTDAARRISRHLGLVDPPVVLAAPGRVVSALRGVAPNGPGEPWAERFDRTRAWLRHAVEVRRPAAVQDAVLRMLQDLLKQIGDGLSLEAGKLTEHHKNLTAAMPTAASGFLKECTQAAATAVDRSERETLAMVHRLVAETAQATGRAIGESVRTAGGGAIEEVLRERVPVLVRRSLEHLERQSRPWVGDGVGGLLASVTGDLWRALAREYGAVVRIDEAPGTGRAVPREAGESAFVDTGPLCAVAEGAAKDLRRRRRSFAWGTGAGAVIGTVFHPVVGTVLGAALGFACGALFAGSVDAVRAGASARARAAADQLFVDAGRRVERWVRGIAGECRAEVARQADWYRATYQREIDARRALCASELQVIRLRGERMGAAGVEVAARREALAGERAGLWTGGRFDAADPFGGRHG